MGSSRAPSRLTPLQADLLAAFFAHEQRWFLTGGAALAAFYLGHRTTEDLDLFSPPGPDLADAERALGAAAHDAGATLERQREYPEFRRLLARRGDEACIVDLVIDRAPSVEPEKATFGAVRADTPREIAANKVCTLLGRAEIKDLVDLEALVGMGVDLDRALEDARRKDAGVDPATLAWVLGEITIGREAALPGGVDPSRISTFRDALVRKLRAKAMATARGAGGGGAEG